MLRGEAALWVVTCSSISDPASVIHCKLLKLKHVFVYPTEAQSPHVAVTEGTHTRIKTKQNKKSLVWLGTRAGPWAAAVLGGSQGSQRNPGEERHRGHPLLCLRDCRAGFWEAVFVLQTLSTILLSDTGWTPMPGQTAQSPICLWHTSHKSNSAHELSAIDHC